MSSNEKLFLQEEFDNNKSGFESFDVCSGRVMTVKKFVEMVKRIAGSDTKLNFGSKEYRKYEIMRLNPNPKLLTNFGWQPSVSLEEGITQMLKNI